jgi:hypothetical protein
MRLASLTRSGRLAGITAVILAASVLPLAAGPPARAAQGAATAVSAASRPVPPPGHRGTLRITGPLRDGATVAATGLAWHKPRLPRGMHLLSFAVAYTWQSCTRTGRHCVTAADSTATPFAARQYRVGHADTGRRLRVTETAAETVGLRADRRDGPGVPAAPGAGRGVLQRDPGAVHGLGRRVLPGHGAAL